MRGDSSHGWDTADRLLADLRGRGELYAAWEELERALGLSREAVGQAVSRLAGCGYQLDVHPGRGVRLVGGPDILLAQEIEPKLRGPRLGGPVHAFRAVGSTNTVALELGAAGAPEGVLVVAEEQLAGRGRHRRSWHSAPGLGLWFSLLLRPPTTPEASSALTIVASLAVSEAVRAVSGRAVRLKWPNDVFLRGRKLAGVLAEVVGTPERVGYVVVGVGVNVNHKEDDFPPALRREATSIAMATGRDVPRVRLLLAVIEGMEKRYSLFLRNGLKEMVEEWNELALWLGETVRLTVGGESRSGIALGLAESGGLLWRTAEGLQEVVLAGDLAPAEGGNGIRGRS